MRDVLIAVAIFAVLPFALARPHIGLYLYSWIGYMNPHRLTYGFAYGFPWAYLAAIVTLLGVLFSKETRRMPWTREMTVLAFFIGWMGVTTFFAFHPEAAWEQAEKVAKIMVMIFLTPLVINNRERLRGLIWVIVLSLAFYGIKGGVFTILHGGIYRVQGPLGSFIGGNNELALALLMTIPLMRFLHLTEQNRWIRLGLLAGMLLTALAAIGSQSRGALVGVAVTGLMFWLKGRNKLITAILFVVAATTVLSIMPAQWYERMNTITQYQEDASALGRINAWWTAWHVALDRPLVGGGFEMFTEETFTKYAPDPDDVHDVHSIYFEILGEHGFIGLGLWVLLAFLAWRKARHVIIDVKSHPERRWAADLASMCQVSMIAYFASGAFLGLAYFDLYFHLLMIIVVTGLLYRHDPPSVTDSAAGSSLGTHANGRVTAKRYGKSFRPFADRA